MQEEKLSPEQSLQVIDSMINRARDTFSENGHLYLLWGWVILFCSLGHFFMEQVLHYDKPWLIWMLTWVAIIYQGFYIARRNRKRRVRTYTDDIIKYVWLVFAICTFLIVFLDAQRTENSNQVNLAFVVMYGMPTFLSGIILRFRPLLIGATACWALALLSLLVPPAYYMLLVAAAMITAWIIPGYLLQRKFHRQKE